MTNDRQLRIRPAMVLAALHVIGFWLVPGVSSTFAIYGLLVGVLSALGIFFWWLFFSRAPWLERFGVIALIAVALAVTRNFVHPSIAGGMMGYMPLVFGIPILLLALVLGAMTGRREGTVLGILGGCIFMLMLRTDGTRGEGQAQLQWRWTQTAEEKLLAKGEEPIPPPPPAPVVTPAVAEPSKTTDAAPAAAAPPADNKDVAWAGFRGAERDSVVRGVKIETDWSQKPPVEMWRRQVGPGWSSFAVSGDVLYTQEQRGEEELVSAYNVKTGAPVWRHKSATRFWESNAGAGPRATPTIHNGRIYTLGGTGDLNALDAGTGAVIWSRNAVSDTGRKIPDWGIAGSPLIVDDVVIVATAGVLAGFEIETGKPRWIGEKAGGGYSSPQLVTIDGVAQVVILNGVGAVSVNPSDGKVLWKHEWDSDGIVQPGIVGSDILIGSGSGLSAHNGMTRVTVAREGAGWSTKERWETNALKPYYNDFVIHNGHAFGFDGGILACVDLENGSRKWKGGRYGHGQMMLLADQDLLLVLSEDGEIALVKATPDKWTELAKVPAIEGKTWNHPVLVGDVLLVRNGEEMAAFRIPLSR